MRDNGHKLNCECGQCPPGEVPIWRDLLDYIILMHKGKRVLIMIVVYYAILQMVMYA